MFTRKLGRSNLQISALGMGCWAIGGQFWRDGAPVGWGHVNDDESLRAIHRALDLGVTFFDTADIYGCGHSERVVGKALAGKRNQVILNVELAQARVVRDALEELVTAGKIRFYGWSTDDAPGARVFAEGAHCVAIQQRLNIFEGDAETLRVCEEHHLASINRSPLAMGLLTGKFTAHTQFPKDAVRSTRFDFEKEKGDQLRMLDAIRTILTQDGRSLAQAALGWLWARSPMTIPIPGFKTIAQVEENSRAMDFGPLAEAQMKEIEQVLRD